MNSVISDVFIGSYTSYRFSKVKYLYYKVEMIIRTFERRAGRAFSAFLRDAGAHKTILAPKLL